MPVNTQQLLAGANYQLESYATGDPVDQINTAHVTLKWFMDHKQPVIFSNGIFNEKVRITNDSNYQRYTGDDQVTFKRKDTARKAPFQHYEQHDGFTLNETELANNGIVMTDDDEAEPTQVEKTQLVSLIKEGWTTLKLGMQENLALDVLQDGSQSSKAFPGLDLIVATDPTTGIVGGLDAASYTFWRNYAKMGISTATAGTLVDELEKGWRACTRYGGMRPDFIPCGSAFYDALRKDAQSVHSVNVYLPNGQQVTMDPATKEIKWNGVPVVWDPDFDRLDDVLGVITYPWAKRCYFLQSKAIVMRPFKGRWMMVRKPERVYDRYTHFFGMTNDCAITTNKRNAHAVFSIA
ncbi:phage major capsid protein [Dyella sp. KRB-257]|uniref:phage major capsid protein n=1 Tax=Dyella sp. KRB-257 TaxID=3400915 RepID=UPI003BFC5C55